MLRRTITNKEQNISSASEHSSKQYTLFFVIVLIAYTFSYSLLPPFMHISTNNLKRHCSAKKATLGAIGSMCVCVSCFTHSTWNPKSMIKEDLVQLTALCNRTEENTEYYEAFTHFSFLLSFSSPVHNSSLLLQKTVFSVVYFHHRGLKSHRLQCS